MSRAAKVLGILCVASLVVATLVGGVAAFKVIPDELGWGPFLILGSSAIVFGLFSITISGIALRR